MFPEKTTGVSKTAFVVITIVLFVSAFLFYRPPEGGLWLRALLNWIHVPAFGCIALATFQLSPSRWSLVMRYGVGFVGALILGALVEAAQIPLGRSASLGDLIADAIGAAAFLLAMYGVHRKSSKRTTAWLAAIILLIGSSQPVIEATRLLYQRNEQFPVIFDGHLPRWRPFLDAENVRLLAGWSSTSDRNFTSLILMDGGRPSVHFGDLVADWSHYSNLLIELELTSNDAITLTIRIHDASHRPSPQLYEDRFNRLYTLQPGKHRISIPLSDVAAAPMRREMDMKRIDALIFFSSTEYATSVINLYEIRLD